MNQEKSKTNYGNADLKKSAEAAEKIILGEEVGAVNAASETEQYLDKGGEFMREWEPKTVNDPAIARQAAAVICVTGVTLSPTSLTMKVNETYQLNACVSPTNADNKGLTWSSSNTSVATVGTGGLVCAKATGNAVITVKTKEGNYTKTCSVKVNPNTIPVTGVSLSPTSVTGKVNDTYQLSACVTPSNATNKELTWSSSNTSVATVGTGVLVCMKAAGNATITVKSKEGNYTKTCSITVAPVLVTSIKITPSAKSMKVGDACTLASAIVLPSDASNKNVTWHSSDESVAKISSGRLICPKKAGTTRITAKAADGSGVVSNECVVTVTEPVIKVENIEIVSYEDTYHLLKVGQTLAMEAIVTPSDADNSEIIWETNRPDVVSVSSSGLLCAKKEGNAMVKAATRDGRNAAYYYIKIIPEVLVESLYIEEVSKDKNTYKLRAVVSPSNATGAIQWISSDTSIATVSSNGTVRRLKDGEVTITAKPVTNVRDISSYVYLRGYNIEEIWDDLIGFIGGSSVQPAAAIMPMSISLGLGILLGLGIAAILTLMTGCESKEEEEVVNPTATITSNDPYDPTDPPPQSDFQIIGADQTLSAINDIKLSAKKLSDESSVNATWEIIEGYEFATFSNGKETISGESSVTLITDSGIDTTIKVSVSANGIVKQCEITVDGHYEIVTMEQLKEIGNVDDLPDDKKGMYNGMAWKNKDKKDVLEWNKKTYIPTYSEKRYLEQKDVDAINACMRKYNIRGAQIPHFIAQLSVECSCGAKGIEQYNGNGPIEYFQGRDASRNNFDDADLDATKEYYKDDDKLEQYVEKNNLKEKYKGYGAKYRGAGAIQLTFYCNYRLYANHVNDPKIIKRGAIRVAKKYYYDSAGWFWERFVSKLFANGAKPTVADVKRAVNGKADDAEVRQNFYNNCIEVLGDFE